MSWAYIFSYTAISKGERFTSSNLRSLIALILRHMNRCCLYSASALAFTVKAAKVGTFHALENEGMVRHILDTYPFMQLVPIHIDLGHPGLPGLGLNASECECVRRFDPSDMAADTIGFFVAKFQKTV